MFERVAATYGSASAAPERLRALADEDPRIAREALYWIAADYFHQDQFCEATPLVVPYLLEVAARPSVVQRDVVAMLGCMLRGGTYARSDLAVFVPRDDPQHLTEGGDRFEPEAEETWTRQAVEAGRPVLAALLDTGDPAVRCMAVWTYAAFGPVARAELEARLAREPDPRVRACAWLALSTLSPTNAVDPARTTSCSEDAIEGASEADLARVVSATALDAVTEDAILRILDVYEVPWLPFAEGRTEWLVLHHLRRLGAGGPALFPFLQRAIEVVGDTRGPLARYACDALFPAGIPRHARELNEAQRWAFRNIWVGEARGVRLRFDDLAGQRAFLDGDGPLDEVVTFGVRTGTVAELLLGQRDDAEALLAERARVWPEARVFELAISILRGDLGDRAFSDATLRACVGSVTLERTLAYLAMHPRPCLPEVTFLLEPYRDPPREPPEALNELVLQRISDNLSGVRDWLRAFSPARLVAVVAPVKNAAALWPLCDRQALGREILARGSEVLRAVPSSLLRERAATADDHERARLEDELTQRASRDRLALSARRIHGMELELMLPNGQRLVQLELDRLQTPADLEPLRAVLRDHPNAAVTVDDSVPSWIGEALGARARAPE